MDSNFTGMNATLISAQFNFNVTKKISQISVDQADEIVIGKIQEHHFGLIITRRLSLSQVDQVLAEATFDVRINTENTETASSITDKVKDGMPILGNVFSRISLVISQITSQSPYGPIITVPAYDKNKVAIRVLQEENE